MLDARDGTVVTIEVPDPTLLMAGWARDRTTVVARGRFDGWLIDSRTHAVRPATAAVNPDWADLAQGDREPRSCARSPGPGSSPAARAARGGSRPGHRVGVEHRGLGGRGRFPARRVPERDRPVAGAGRRALRPATDPTGARGGNRAARAGGCLPGTGLGAPRRGAVRVAFGESGFPRTRAPGAGVGRQRGACSTRSPTSTGRPPAPGEFSGTYTL